MKKFPILSFLDVETTGLSSFYNDRIVEVAVLKVFPDGNKKQWHTLLNPMRPISHGAMAIHCITDDMVVSSPKFSDIAQELVDIITGTVLVCHNAPFDMSFISYELNNAGLMLPDLQVIDTLTIARRYFEFPSNSLGNIAQFLNIDVSTKHRAMADVDTTHKIFERMWQALNERGMNDIEKFFVQKKLFAIDQSRALVLPPTLEDAIKNHAEVFISYESAQGGMTQRLVKPFEVVKNNDYLYLVAYCDMRKEKRTFRLDRIVEMKMKEKRPQY